MSIVIYVSHLDFPAFDWSAPWQELFAIASSETVWIGYSSGELRVVAYDEEKRDRFVVAAMDVLIDELGYHPDDIAEPHYYSQCVASYEHSPPPGLPPPPGLARGASPHVGGVSPHVGGVSPHVGGGSPTARGSASPHVGGVSPSRGGASSLLKIAVHDVHRDPSQMLLVPTEAVRARVLADLIGGKEMVEMSRLSLASNIHYDGKSAWIGLQIWEVSIRWRSVLGMKVVGAPTGVALLKQPLQGAPTTTMPNNTTTLLHDYKVKLGNSLVITDIDAHMTLMYVKQSALGELDAIMEGLEERLTAMSRSQHERKCVLKFNEQFAEPDYAWADLLVTSQAHSGVHALVAAGLRRRSIRGSTQGLTLKDAFHMSIRTYGRTQLVCL